MHENSPLISVLGIPWDEQSSYLRGSAGGPQAIRDAFRCESSNTFCEDGFDLAHHPRIQDQGDLSLGTGQAARSAIALAVKQQVTAGHRVLILGGDHALTWPVLRGMRTRYPQLTVLHFDAHPDLYDHLDGNRFSHATPMKRSLEEGLIDYLIQVGVRTMNEPQQIEADRYGVVSIPMQHLNRLAELNLSGPIYLSLDLDVLDPAFAPGVSHHEPGGMSTRELIGLIQQLNIELVGADIVELNPTRDWNSLTAMTAAKLMKEILAVMLRRGPPPADR